MSQPNILLIAVDSLLATHMSCYGYGRQTTPHIDRFATEGTLFENAISPHIPTTSGYAGILTGRDCFGTQVVALRHKGTLPDDVPTLPEVMGKHGYETVCVGFKGNAASRGFGTYLNFSAWEGSGDGRMHKAEALNNVFMPALSDLARGGKPWFVMLRHMDPHSPYLPPSPFDKMFYHGDPCDPANKSMEPVRADKVFRDYLLSWMPEGITDKDYVIAQYDGELAYMDACIQPIFTQLRSLGVLDNTIVVFTSDHGETLYDHDCFFDHHGLYDVTLKVPMIVRYPAKVPAGRRIRGFCQLKNIMPTILELAGIDAGAKFDGPSLMRLVDGSAASFESGIYITECTWMRKHGWRTPQWKLIVALEPDFHGKPAVELYNLVEDPNELNNVADANPEVVAALRATMDKHIARRQAETGKGNTILNQPGWHGKGDTAYFTSSEQARDTLHIGSVKEAQKIQAEGRK